MSESKTYIFDGAGGSAAANTGLLAAILPSLQQRGIDTAALMSMAGNNKNNGGLFGSGNGFGDLIGLVIAAGLFGNNNGGGLFGGGDNNAEREMIMSAIQRNGVDIGQLAQSLNMSTSQLMQGINSVANSICQLGNQMGQNTNQIIMQMMNGNNALVNQIANCCCDLKQAISNVNYLTERGFCNTNQILAQGFSNIGYETQRQTCDLQNTIKDSTAQILAGQAAIEKREMQREIAALQEEKQTYKLGSMIGAATAPIMAEVQGLKCKLPKTEVVNVQPEYVPINRGINIPYGYCGGGWNNAWWNNNSLWG